MSIDKKILIFNLIILAWCSNGTLLSQSERGIAASINYAQTINLLKNMLEGREELSLKKTYYELENCWGNNYLQQPYYDDIIFESGTYIKNWLLENNQDINNNLALNYGVCSFLKDTLTLSNGEIHLPFQYDYLDYKAEFDYRNSFVTKAFATGTGQCNTLPIMYLILAEELGAEAWISYAPYHSFIKFKDNSGTVHNYDPASGMYITDQLYQDYLFISTEAEQSRIYLEPLTKKQLIATCLLDLTNMYIAQFEKANLYFAEDCIDYALTFFYKKESNIFAWLLKSNIALNRLNQYMLAHEFSDHSFIKDDETAMVLYNKYVAIENKIKYLGYRDLPKQQYAILMKSFKEKEAQQLQSGINTKESRNLFLNNQ